MFVTRTFNSKSVIKKINLDYFAYVLVNNIFQIHPLVDLFAIRNKSRNWNTV